MARKTRLDAFQLASQARKNILLPTSTQNHGVPKSRPRVISVTIAFEPDQALLLDQLRALSAQVAESIVVDNHSTNSDHWQALVADLATVIAFPANLGIGAAQNSGIRHALSRGATHVLLLDHDSVPDAGMVEALLQAEEGLDKLAERVAAVGPRHVDSRTGAQSRFIEAKADVDVRCQDSTKEVDFLISSGILLRSETLVSIGLMNEGFFIDHVDTEWCLRARSKGYRIFGVPSATLQHRIGDRVVRVWFGRWRNVSVHSPCRNYYMSRNTCLMLGSKEISAKWRLRLAIRLLQHLLFFSMLISPRRARIAHMLRGVLHGILGVTGPLGATAARSTNASHQ